MHVLICFAMFFWGMFFSIMREMKISPFRSFFGSAALASIWPIMVVFMLFCPLKRKVQP